MGYLFGQCGCCQSPLGAGDVQNVIAWVPFNFGWAKDPRSGFFGATSAIEGLGSSVCPSVLYRTTTITWTSDLGGSYEQVFTYNQYGTLTREDADPQPGPGRGASPHWTEGAATYSDPYGYDEAVQNCIGLLAKVALLNPTAVYQVTFTDFDGNAYQVPCHLCYTAELAQYNQPVPHVFPDGTSTLVNTAYTALVVSPDGQGNPIISIVTAHGLIFFFPTWHRERQMGRCSRTTR